MAEKEFTAKKVVLKDIINGNVQYLIPYVPNGTLNATGLVKPDGTTIGIENGVISVADNLFAAADTTYTKEEVDNKINTLIVYRQW